MLAKGVLGSHWLLLLALQKLSFVMGIHHLLTRRFPSWGISQHYYEYFNAGKVLAYHGMFLDVLLITEIVCKRQAT